MTLVSMRISVYFSVYCFTEITKKYSMYKGFFSSCCASCYSVSGSFWWLALPVPSQLSLSLRSLFRVMQAIMMLVLFFLTIALFPVEASHSNQFFCGHTGTVSKFSSIEKLMRIRGGMQVKLWHKPLFQWLHWRRIYSPCLYQAQRDRHHAICDS